MPLARIRATPAARLTIWCFGAYGVLQGLWMALADPMRLGGPAYTLMRQVPHAHLVWGITLAVGGATILCGSLTFQWRVKAVGLLILSAWCTCFAVSSLTATATMPYAGSTGGPTYLLIAFTSAIVIAINEEPPAVGIELPDALKTD